MSLFKFIFTIILYSFVVCFNRGFSVAFFTQMEKTVEIDENLKFLRELEMFSRNMSSSHLFDGADKSKVLAGARDGDQFGSPLEQLGLFIKDDYMDEYEDSEQILNEEGEEGEILS